MNTSESLIKSQDICAVDFGSKNFKFVIGRKIGFDIETELFKKEPMGLGQELIDYNGTISKKKLEHIEQVLTDFKELCAKRNITTILGVGTSAIRSAKNRDEISQLIHNCGVSFEVAHGRREGESVIFPLPTVMIAEVELPAGLIVDYFINGGGC
ncbi:MAG: hypothetical protein HQL70_06775 [Magnetococcales bacterium]|nr:hypothetical protein [Magnetococcales bacterium]